MMMNWKVFVLKIGFVLCICGLLGFHYVLSRALNLQTGGQTSLCPSGKTRIGDSSIDRVFAIDLHPNGKQLAIITGTGIYIYDVEKLALQSVVQCHANVPSAYALDWSKDGRYLAAYTDIDVGIRIWQWDVATMKIVKDLRSGSDPGLRDGNGESITPFVVKTLAWSFDGTYIAAIGSLPLRVWDVNNEEIIFQSKDVFFDAQWNPNPSAFAWSPTERYLALAHGAEIQVWDIQTWQGLPALTSDSQSRIAQFSSISWSSDDLLAVGGDNVNLEILETETWQAVTKCKEPIAANTVSWSPDGKILAVAGNADATISYERIKGITLLDGRTCDVLKILPANELIVQKLEWTPDGKRLISLTSEIPDSTIYTWNVESGQVIAELKSNNE